MKNKVLLLCTCILFLSGCANTDEGNQSTNADDETQQEYENEQKYVVKDNIFDADESVEVDGISYQIISISSGTELGNHRKEDVNYLTDEVDEDGNFLGNNRFIWIELATKNENETKTEIVVSSNGFYCIGSDWEIFETGAEAVYISPKDTSFTKPSEVFHCILEPGETRNICLGYWIDKKNVDGHLYYGIGHSGSEIDDVNNKFLDVEEFWNEE